MSKLFIVSLPRTGTTSACAYLLELGFTVAHTAYTRSVFEQADVVADTPVFIDYPKLLQQYPNAKCIYLERPKELWLLSIRRLLKSMRKQWARDKHVFEPAIQRCFQNAFPDFENKTDYSDHYLNHCYQTHHDGVMAYMSNMPERFLTVDITESNAGKILQQFCLGYTLENETGNPTFPHVNQGRRITYWESITHKNKIESRL
ncbi:sulfotransferase [Teredinibacter sp. KSP-S5-2]|uniref:sulfotransferase n=1 Tax=Teredinibacter sp. KSP-S5-2 TaxID=3034506 RepID=UPI00293421DE|nr:sulfotransferase [Teredinibacter sp. KSP-S5-2]WNO07806.1 sulfotransferase [Teredinibacter sp. KSP-S5-2]